MEVEQREVERWVVTTDMVEARKLAREARLATRNSQTETEPVSMEVSPPPGQETGPVNTRTISIVPPPDQDTAFPSSLLAVPTITSPTPTMSGMSTLPTAWLPIIASDQAVTATSQPPHSDRHQPAA